MMDILKGRPCPDCDNGVAPKGGNESIRYDCPGCSEAELRIQAASLTGRADGIRETIDSCRERLRNGGLGRTGFYDLRKWAERQSSAYEAQAKDMIDCPDCDNGVAPKGGNEGTTRYDCPTCRPAPKPGDPLVEEFVQRFWDECTGWDEDRGEPVFIGWDDDTNSYPMIETVFTEAMRRARLEGKAEGLREAAAIYGGGFGAASDKVIQKAKALESEARE